MSYREHKKEEVKSIKVAIVVTSDKISRGEREDVSGRLAEEEFKSAGHEIIEHIVVPNDVNKIRETVRELSKKADVILVTGGTGFSDHDVSIEAVSQLFKKKIPGFGEIFRAETFRDLGYAAWLSRAEGGIINNAIVFIIPGSPSAVKTALRIILPEIKHAIFQLRKGGERV